MSTEGPEPRRRRLFGSRRKAEPEQAGSGLEARDAPRDQGDRDDRTEQVSGAGDEETRSVAAVEPLEERAIAPEAAGQVTAAAPDTPVAGDPPADSGPNVVETSDRGGHVGGNGPAEVQQAQGDTPHLVADESAQPAQVTASSDASRPSEPSAATGQPGSPENVPVDANGAAGVSDPVTTTQIAAAVEAAGEAEADGSTPPVEELQPLDLPTILAIANQKGGVGKTTTAVNLGASLAELGFRVLVIDLDPQGNATTGLGINPRNLQGSIYDVVMNNARVEDCVEPTSLKNLFVVPATIDLAGAEIELVPAFSRELKLRRALEEVRDDYDFTLIDCPPSLGLLTVNGLAAADAVIVPIQCEYYALEGLGQLLRNVALVRTNLNPTLDVRGIVLTMYDARTKLADQVEQEVRNHFGAKVYRAVVPRTVRLSEAPSFGQPIIVFDPTSRGAIAYRELAKEVSRGAARRVG
jgi:chromosome partitioning protein